MENAKKLRSRRYFIAPDYNRKQKKRFANVKATPVSSYCSSACAIKMQRILIGKVIKDLIQPSRRARLQQNGSHLTLALAGDRCVQFTRVLGRPTATVLFKNGSGYLGSKQSVVYDQMKQKGLKIHCLSEELAAQQPMKEKRRVEAKQPQEKVETVKKQKQFEKRCQVVISLGKAEAGKDVKSKKSWRLHKHPNQPRNKHREPPTATVLPQKQNVVDSESEIPSECKNRLNRRKRNYDSEDEKWSRRQLQNEGYSEQRPRHRRSSLQSTMIKIPRPPPILPMPESYYTISYNTPQGSECCDSFVESEQRLQPSQLQEIVMRFRTVEGQPGVYVLSNMVGIGRPSRSSWIRMFSFSGAVRMLDIVYEMLSQLSNDLQAVLWMAVLFLLVVLAIYLDLGDYFDEFYQLTSGFTMRRRQTEKPWYQRFGFWLGQLIG